MSNSRIDDLYAKLQVPRNATDKDIKESFKRLVFKYHPDKVKDHDRDFAHNKLKDIKAAYGVIGNPAKRIVFEEQAAQLEVLNKAPSRMYGDFSIAAHKRCDVWLAPEFLLVPIGHADKFMRCVDQTMVFHSREDRPNTGFDEFFTTARFAFSWRFDVSNPTGQPKFYGMCNLELRPTASSGKSQGDSGWLSFGLTPVSTSSDVMLMKGAPSPGFCDLTLVPSPICSKAFRFESVYFPGHFLAFEPPNHCVMTNTINQFATIDFVLAGLNASCQFQRLDEVLIPTVARLGGDKKYIKLTEVCKDQSVRQYFHSGMGCVWDFDDFTTYFLAHYETWQYNPETLCVKLRVEFLEQKDEMRKREQQRKQEADHFLKEIESGELTAKRAKTVPTRSPTKVLVLNNLVGAGEVDSDLEEETSEEASKNGKVRKCIIKELRGAADEEAVRIFLEFEAVESAGKAFEVFNGRLFAGRTVKAWYYDEGLYKAGELEKKESDLPSQEPEQKSDEKPVEKDEVGKLPTQERQQNAHQGPAKKDNTKKEKVDERPPLKRNKPGKAATILE